MKLVAFLLVFMLAITSIPVTSHIEMDLNAKGQGLEAGDEDFSPWLSYEEVVPLRKTTLVMEDNEGLFDDYRAYGGNGHEEVYVEGKPLNRQKTLPGNCRERRASGRARMPMKTASMAPMYPATPIR